MTAANVAPGAGKRSVRPLIQLLALHQQSLMLDLKLSSYQVIQLSSYPAPRMDHSHRGDRFCTLCDQSNLRAFFIGDPNGGRHRDPSDDESDRPVASTDHAHSSTARNTPAHTRTARRPRRLESQFRH